MTNEEFQQQIDKVNTQLLELGTASTEAITQLADTSKSTDERVNQLLEICTNQLDLFSTLEKRVTKLEKRVTKLERQNPS